MVPRRSDSLITALGYNVTQERLYQRLLTQSGREWLAVPAALMRDVDELRREMDPYVASGIIRFEDGRMVVASPAEVLVRMLEETADESDRATARMRAIADAMPFLSATGARPRPGDVHDVAPLDGELSSGGDVPSLLRALLLQSKGDLLQLRPDQWRHAGTSAGHELVGTLISSGRRMRTIHPVQALHDAPDTLQARAAAGEEVRLLPEVPTRMLLIGHTHAVLPEPLGFVDEPRSLIRQRGIVDALVLWFEELWDRAVPLPAPGAGTDGTDVRRFLLQELAGGAQDEQIARRLGISLRTVRRRVAELLTELGADSRFQAGVEAARRGWL
jgi:DNA-binding CsgD family transcriptional regulator